MKSVQMFKYFNLKNYTYFKKIKCKQEKPNLFLYFSFVHKDKRVIIFRLVLVIFNYAETIRKINEEEKTLKRVCRFSNLI